MSETEYLTQQAADAKTAMAHVVRGVVKPLERGANEHPLLVIGAAAIAGALAARALSPSGHNGEREKQRPRRSFLDGLFTDAIKPLAVDLIPAAIAAISKMFVQPPQDAPSSRVPPV